MSIALTLGPLLFHWSPARVAEFYARIADEADVGRVYLGEVVCAKRRPRTEEALRGAEERLSKAGKEVVWSGLALPSAAYDRRAIALHAARASLVEINDLSSLWTRAETAPFVAGPLLNVYNEDAARMLMARGCVRLCANIELSLDAVAAIHQACPALELELFAFGRAPLAISARCYHARANSLHKDGCQFVCERDRDGLAIATLEGEPFLAINGVQTLSHGYHCLDAAPDALTRAGVTALRLSPHTGDMVALARTYRKFLGGQCDRATLLSVAQAAAHGAGLVNGYAYAQPGITPVEAS